MKSSKDILTVSENRTFGGTKITQQTEGWPGAGFERQFTDLTLRRIIKPDRDELQISVEIRTLHRSGRVTNKLGSLCIPAESLPQVIAAITTAWTMPETK